MFFKCSSTGSANHGHIARAPAEMGHQIKTTNGKKHFTVDIHCHIHVPAADRMLENLSPEFTQRSMVDTNPLTTEINTAQQKAILPKLTDPTVRLKDMDSQGIDVQAISPSPFHYTYGLEAEFTRDTSKVINDRVAEVVASHPDRFVGLGTVPLQNSELAVAELDRCVKELGLKGVEISTNVNGKDLTRAGLEKFFSRAEELGILIFMHPIGTSYKERMDDHYFRNTIGHPLESALAVGHLVFDGYLERYPGLKICIAHGGGYIPAYYGRFDHPYGLRDDCRQLISKPPSEYINMLYFDTVVFTETQLRHMIEVWGADRIIMGTDYPYDMAEPDPVGHVNSVLNLSDEDKAKIMGNNAAQLLNIKVSV
ncbi:MAG: amidohydrolase family protein [Pseudomonadota bacterium]|nr:amidohydrolase family protein [Pseudomonadota bacterium]